MLNWIIMFKWIYHFISRSNTQIESCIKTSSDEFWFLLSVKVAAPLPGSIESDLQALLLKLPLTGLDPCTTWFTRNAILTGKSASQHRRVRFNDISSAY